MSEIRILICTRGESQYLHELILTLQDQISRQSEKVSLGIACNLSDLGLLLNDIDVVTSVPSGYASTRQAALKLRKPGEGVIFLDDDNIVQSDWLLGLMNSTQRYPNHILKGHVNYIDEDYLRTPMLNDGLRSGKELHFAGMSNLYFPSFVVDTERFAFNLDFNQGGEDTELTFKLWKSGYKILTLDGFPVFEIVSLNKESPDYLAKRLLDSRIVFDKVVSLHGDYFEKFKRIIPWRIKTLISHREMQHVFQRFTQKLFFFRKK